MKAWILIALALFLPLACGAGNPALPSTDQPSADPSPVDAEAVCAELSEKPCMDSPDCTLVPDDEAQGGYLCRQALAPCETGFRQGLDPAADCSAKAGCAFVPGRCYCAPDVTCICGGGPPPSCVEASQAPEPPAG